MDFFVIGMDTNMKPSSPVTEFSDLPSVKRGPAPQCKLCGKFIGGLTMLPPIAVELELWGNGFADFVFGPGDHPLISSRFLNVIAECQITGFDCIAKVKVSRITRGLRKLKHPPDYYYCKLDYSRAAIDKKASELLTETEVLCQECRFAGTIESIKSVCLEPNTWSGEDIFFARGLPGTKIVSQRFYDCVIKHKITGMLMIPAESYSFK